MHIITVPNLNKNDSKLFNNDSNMIHTHFLFNRLRTGMIIFTVISQYTERYANMTQF